MCEPVNRRYTLHMSYPSRRCLLSRIGLTLLALLSAMIALIAQPSVASAQPPPAIPPSLSSGSSTPSVDAFIRQANAQLAAIGNGTAARDTAWNLRASLRQQADALAVINPNLPAQAKASIDQTVETLFPGLIAARTPKPAPPPPAPPPPAPPAPPAQPAPAPPAAAPAFDYGSCPRDAKACIDLNGRRSWLQSNGQVYYGSVFIGPGRPGYETPRGTFYVNRKVKDEISYEFDNAPMPYAVYFTNNGIAFHQGDPSVLSHGCIRMHRADAQKYFDELRIGDKVYVY